MSKIKNYMELIESAYDNENKSEKDQFLNAAKDHFQNAMSSKLPKVIGDENYFELKGVDREDDELVKFLYENETDKSQLEFSLYIDRLIIDSKEDDADGEIALELKLEYTMALFYINNVDQIELMSNDGYDSYGLVVRKKDSGFGSVWESILDRMSVDDVIGELIEFDEDIEYFVHESVDTAENYIKIYYNGM